MSLIAGMVGLLAAGLGLYAMFHAIGFFQYLGGKKRSNIPPVSKEELVDRLLSLNDPSKPYRIIKGVGADVIAEWKIADAEWYGIFNKSGLKEAYRAHLLVDEARYAVRCYEELGTITWTVGLNGPTPSIHYRKSFFHGRILYKKEYAKGYGIKRLKPIEIGKVYDYRFDIDEIRDPMIAAVEESGWEWVPVTAKRHVIRKQPRHIT